LYNPGLIAATISCLRLEEEGESGHGPPRGKAILSRIGNLCEACYERFGDCEAFVLDEGCDEKRKFKVKEKRLCELVLRTCCEKLEVTVVVEKRNLERVVGLRICYYDRMEVS
jgi:hypothetical protein